MSVTLDTIFPKCCYLSIVMIFMGIAMHDWNDGFTSAAVIVMILMTIHMMTISMAVATITMIVLMS